MKNITITLLGSQDHLLLQDIKMNKVNYILWGPQQFDLTPKSMLVAMKQQVFL